MLKRSPLSASLLLAAMWLPNAFAASADVDPRIGQLLGQLGKVRSVEAVAMSPDGTQLAWVIQHEGKPTIEVAAADGSHAHSVSAAARPGACAESGVAWAPDSHHLAFVSDCGNDPTSTKVMQNTIYLADTTGNAAPTVLVQLKGFARALQWTTDGKSLGFLYVPDATRHASPLYAAKPAAGEVGVSGMEVQRVASVDINSRALRELTPSSIYAYEFDWSPDGSQIAYTAAPAPGDNNWWVAKLYVQPAQVDASATVLVDPARSNGSLHGLQMALPRWSPDATRIAFIGGLMSDQGSTGGDIYAVSTHGGSTAVDLTPGIHVTPAWLSWTNAQKLLVSQVANGQSQVAEYHVGANAASLERTLFSIPAGIGDGSADMALALSHDHQHVAFVQSSYTAAPEVYAGALATVAPPAVTQFNAGLKPAWGKAESVEWNNDGFHVQGWLLYPADYDAQSHSGKKYPMIVSVHGGPSSAVIPRWPSVGYGSAPFSALGYFVFMPNPRGSYGQGEKYVQANRRDFGYGDLRDVLAGVDAVEKKVPVDDKRLGLTGWSYGGFMTMFAVTQTQRFHAAVAGAGIANWQSYYGQNLIDQWMPPFFGASVYDDPTIYAKSSAINFIKQVKTPTLVVVGDRDAECPAPQSFEFWHALRAQNVPTSLVVYPNEGHHFVDPAHQRDVLQRALSWFGKYLPASE